MPSGRSSSSRAAPSASVGQPVRQVVTPSGVRAWLVADYACARAALADPRLAKDADGLTVVLRERGLAEDEINRFTGALARHMLNSDPPAHTRLRMLVNRAFTPRRIQHLRPRVREICDALLDGLPAGIEVDLLEEFAVPLPTTVICELFGVPSGDRSNFRSLSNVLVSALPGAQIRAASEQMEDYLRSLVAAKRAAPADDMLSALLLPDTEGERLDDDGIVAMAVLLLAAGHETTVNLIGNGMLALLDKPAQLAELRRDRDLLPGAIEEFLRYDGPVSQATLRFSTEPVELGGQSIPAGELLVVSLDAANRDPCRFSDPDRLDIHRDSRGHLAFGHGIHFCLGAPIARLEAEIAFAGLLDRFDHIELTVGRDQLRWRTSTIMRGLEWLPVRLRRARQ